mmetsp:Transcript_41815/g.81976  ORF Transcript_41815/g.81976 Transcript_41815/m.81976 type:complete len:82 (+) Transcript_41815:194-439(+)
MGSLVICALAKLLLVTPSSSAKSLFIEGRNQDPSVSRIALRNLLNMNSYGRKHNDFLTATLPLSQQQGKQLDLALRRNVPP